MYIPLTPDTALNLTLQGTVGSFQIRTSLTGKMSIQVKYFLTHISLNLSSGSNDALLSSLEPVREVFDFASLDFDEIMIF